MLAAGENFRAADQDARIDAHRPADQAEHDHGSNAEPATSAHRKTEAATAAAESPATIVAAIVDVVAAAEVIVTHRNLLNGERQTRHATARKISC